MTTIAVAVRVALAFVLGAAAYGKLADPSDFRRTLRKLGLPTPVDRVLTIGVPLAELVVAAALLFRSTALVATGAAAALFAGFSAVVLWVLLSGRQVDCRCFGKLHGARIRWPTLLRNAILLLLAVGSLPVIAADPGAGLEEIASLSISQILILVNSMALVGVGAFGFLLWRQQGRLILRLDALEQRRPRQQQEQSPVRGLPIGSVAPAVALLDSGGMTTLQDLILPDRPLLLLFVEAGCRHCRSVLRWIDGWSIRNPDAVHLAVVSIAGDRNEVEEELSTTRLAHYSDRTARAASAFEVALVPSAVLVRPDGRVGSRLAQGPAAIERLVTGLVEPRSERPTSSAPSNGDGLEPASADGPPAIGDPVPAFTLKDIARRTLQLGTPGDGIDRVILFWNPGCPHCATLLPQLTQHRASAPEGPALVLVTTEPVEPDPLSATVVVDVSSSLARKFGARGTPGAILLDGEGRLASEVVYGGTGILRLLGPAAPEPMRSGRLVPTTKR